MALNTQCASWKANSRTWPVLANGQGSCQGCLALLFWASFSAFSHTRFFQHWFIYWSTRLLQPWWLICPPFSMFSLPAGTLISGLACSHKERASQVLITQLQLFFSESESILCNHNTILYFNNTAGFFPPLSLCPTGYGWHQWHWWWRGCRGTRWVIREEPTWKKQKRPPRNTRHDSNMHS